MNIKWKKEECKILEGVYFKESKEEILSLLPKYTWNSIKHKAQSMGLKKNTHTSNGDLDILLEEKMESYYWIGFIMADGSINHKRNVLTIRISKKDIEHLERFANYIKNGKVGHIKRKFDLCNVDKLDNDSVPKIIKKFNFLSQKTYNPPKSLNIKDNDAFITFIIGYIDGDGCITKDNRIQIECHKSWGECLNNWFKRIWTLSDAEILSNTTIIPKTSTKNGNALISTRNYKILSFLKSKAESLNIPYMKRKWSRIKFKKTNTRNVFDLKKNAITLLESGFKNKEISKHLNISRGYASLISRGLR